MPDIPASSPTTVRVSLASSSAHVGLEPCVIDIGEGGRAVGPGASSGLTVLRRLDAERAVLVTEGDVDRNLILLTGTAGPPVRNGVRRREVVVDGWRVEVDVESEARAALRARATRGVATSGSSGPTEVRAMIPGVVLSVAADVGDTVEAGQKLLVVEAMKMQNELRAPRDGTVARVAVATGARIEVGDLLLVIT